LQRSAPRCAPRRPSAPPQGAAQSRSLTRLDLEHKGLTAAGAAHVAAVLRGAAPLRQLPLSRNALGDAGAAALAAAAAGAAGLEALERQHCGIGPAGLAALAAGGGGGGWPALRSLLLCGNDLSGDGAGDAAAALLRGAPALTSLGLAGCRLGGAGAAGLAAGLSLPGGAPLAALDLSGCELDDGAAAALAAALRAGAPLARLALGGNPALSDVGVAALAAAAAEAPGCRLERLDVSGSGIGPAALAALGAAACLRTLSLFNTRLGDDGARALAGCLSAGAFAGLADLDLAGCGVTLEGAVALFAALPGARALRALELGANPCVDDEGFEPALESLREARPDLDIHWRAGDAGEGPRQ